MSKARLFFILLFLLPGLVHAAAIKENAPLASSNIVLTGENNGDKLGYSLKIVGDVNGDGIADMVVGAPGYNLGGLQGAGKIYLVLGRNHWAPTSDQALIAPILSTAIASYTGESASDQLGAQISAAGDVNGDGYADILVSAQSNNAGGANAGRVYLILGHSSGWALNQSIASADVIYTGEYPSGYAGRSITNLGDFNGDGLDDFAIGAPTNTGRGKVYLILGKQTGWKHDNVISEADISFLSEQNSTYFGRTIAGVGDVNKDGFADLVVSEYAYPLAQGSNSAKGKVSLILGKATGWGTNMPVSENIAASWIGEFGSNYLGEVVAACGDVNGDSYSDFIIGSPQFVDPLDYDTWKKGKVYLISGKPVGWNKNVDIEQDSAASWLGENISDSAGAALSGVGDLNGDGMSEILIGAPGYSPAVTTPQIGKAYIFMGRSAGYVHSGLMSDSEASYVGGQVNDLAAQSLSGAGDMSGDGVDDLAIGAPQAGDNRQGAVYINFLYTNDPPVAVSRVSLFVSSNYMTAAPVSLNVSDTLWVELRGDDGNALVTNNAIVRVVSGTDPAGMTLTLLETSYNSGIYRGVLTTSARSTSAKERRLHVSGGDTLSVISAVPSSNGTYPSADVGFLNNPPQILLVSPNQIVSSVMIEYVIKDLQEDDVAFNQQSGQVQYAPALDGPWTAATLSGTVADVFTDVVGVTHNLSFYPLYWHPGVVSGSYYLRMKPKDFVAYADNWVTSSLFSVDTVPPTAPIWTMPTLVSQQVLTVSAWISEDTVSYDMTLSGAVLVSINFVPGLLFHATCNLVEGQNVLTLGARDSRLNRSYTTATLTLDTLPPAPPGVSVNAINTSVSSFVITGTCSLDTVTLNLSSTTTFSADVSLNLQAGTWTASVNSMALGNSVMTFTAYDLAWNASRPVTLGIYIDNIPPTPAVLSDIPTMSARAVNLTGQTWESNLTIYLYRESQLIGVTHNSGLLDFVFPFVAVSPTQSHLDVILEDLAGNRSASSNLLSIAFATAQLIPTSSLVASCQLEVPVGALPIETTLNARILTPSVFVQQYGPLPPGLSGIVGLDFKLSGYPDWTTLNQALTLSMQLLDRVNTPDFQVLYWDGSGWVTGMAQIVDTSNGTLTIVMERMGAFFLVSSPLDRVSPNIGLLLIEGGLIVPGDYVPAQPHLSVLVTDNASIQSYLITIRSFPSNAVISVSVNTFINIVTLNQIEYMPDALADGHYFFELKAIDQVGNISTRQSVDFCVNQNDLVADFLSAPNPWNPLKSPLTLGYHLSRSAQVKLVLFDLNGQVVYQWDYEQTSPYGSPGYHQLTWDGRHEGHVLKNGVYWGYFISKSDVFTRQQKFRIAIIK